MKTYRPAGIISAGLAATLLMSSCAGSEETKATSDPSSSVSESGPGQSSASGSKESNSPRDGDKVPNVRSKNLDEALKTLKDKGFKTQVKGEEIKDYKVPDDPQNWRVLAQNPAPDETVEKDSFVQLAVQKKDEK